MRILTALLSWLSRQLPAYRRDWGEAVAAEASTAESGWPRVSWLVGGIVAIALEAGMFRRALYTLLALVTGAALVWLGWHPGSTNPGAPTDRAFHMGLMLGLAALPWILKPWLGPVADNRTARVVRAGGFVGLYALLGVMVLESRFASARFDHMVAFDQDNWNAEMRQGSIVGGIVVVTMMSGYLVAILALTSRRRPVPPDTLTIGSVAGVAIGLLCYVLMPFGGPIVAGLSGPIYIGVFSVITGGLLLAGFLAGRRTSPVDGRSWATQGVLAGLCAGAAAAIVVGVLTVTTMVSNPQRVELRWANPDPAVAHGTQFEWQMSVGDASGKYLVFLLLGPLLGVVLGAIGGTRLQDDPPAQVASRQRAARQASRGDEDLRAGVPAKTSRYPSGTAVEQNAGPGRRYVAS